MFWQWIFGIAFVGWIIVSTPKLDNFSILFNIIGLILLFIGIIGRIYSTLYIGGMKNEGSDGNSFIDDGIYKACRNPLYFFSFLGLIGLLFLKGQICFIFIGGGLFLLVYHFTILKEEAFLRDKFGKSYEKFLSEVPRFFPNFSKFSYKERIEIRPFFLHKELKRAIVWIIAAFFIYIVSYFHSVGILPALVSVY